MGTSMVLGRFDWSSWIQGILAGFIGGGAGAVVTGISVSATDPTHYSLQDGSFYKLVFTVFLVNGLITTMAYLRQNPIPHAITTTSVETTKQEGTPTVTVAKVETTKVSNTP